MEIKLVVPAFIEAYQVRDVEAEAGQIKDSEERLKQECDSELQVSIVAEHVVVLEDSVRIVLSTCRHIIIVPQGLVNTTSEESANQLLYRHPYEDLPEVYVADG